MRSRSKPKGPARAGVFISYARSDGARIAAKLRERLETEKIPLWQDLVSEVGGRDWWLQITEALNHVEFMALIITPKALMSETVRREWRYARQERVCVYPVVGTPHMDSTILPRWLRDKHIYDLNDPLQWKKFLNDLNTRCQAPRAPFMLQDVPDFVPRPQEYEKLRGLLLDGNDGGPVAITAALRGAGGFGKTTLARKLCHDEAVQEAFDDGILWVTLGENPGDLAGRVSDLIETLSGQRPNFSDVNAAAARLRELLSDRDVLLVVDDLWNPAHLTPFLPPDGEGTCLITTRIVDTLPPGTNRVDVDAMRSDEAVGMLRAGGLDGITRDKLQDLAARLGEWPLLLKIVNGVLRHRVNVLGQQSAAALKWVNTALHEGGLTVFDAASEQGRDRAVGATLSVSLRLLDEAERKRYGELAVFPEDVETPLATLAKLWGRTGELSAFRTEMLCERLERLSLLLRFDPDRQVVVLHDVVRQYLIAEQRTQLKGLHDALLAAHEPPFAGQDVGQPPLGHEPSDGNRRVDHGADRAPRDWSKLPQAEPYLWDHLVHHLIEADRKDELLATVKDLRYLTAKTTVRNALATERDLLNAEILFPRDLVLRLLRHRFVQSGHLLNRCQNRHEAEATLFSRLSSEPELQSLTKAWSEVLWTPFVAPMRSLPDLPDPALVRTLSGHEDFVNGCALSQDGRVLVSASADRTLKLWDLENGVLLRTLGSRHKEDDSSAWMMESKLESVSGCAMSADGAVVVAASSYGWLNVWDAASGRLQRSLRAHGEAVNGCALSGDGTVLLSASEDRTLTIWDVASGSLRHTLSGHAGSVNGCALNSDGTVAVSASADETLKVWDVQSGSLRRTLSGHAGAVHGCALSRNGMMAVSASNDKTLKVWEVASGRLLQTLTGHVARVNACALSEDGTKVASASNDLTLKIWDLTRGELLQTLSGHIGRLKACALSRDGALAVSASNDKTLKVWDTIRKAPAWAFNGHSEGVTGCALSKDGALAVSSSYDRSLKVWDVPSGKPLKTLIGHKGVVSGCALSSDGAIVVSSSYDRTLGIWDTATGQKLRKLRHEWGEASSCALSGNGAVVASGSYHRTLKVWDATTGSLRRSLYGHTLAVKGCATSDDGAVVVSASLDGTLNVWDTRNWKLLQTLRGHSDAVTGCALSGDGTIVVSASRDQTLIIWDARSGSLLQTLSGHSARVTGCALSADTALVVSVSDDQTLKVWKTASGECLATLQVDGPLLSCAIDERCERIVAGGARGVYFLRLVH